MKALTLWQPWASLWVAGIKVHETRAWPTKYRGPLLVHAAKRPIVQRDLPLPVAMIGSRMGTFRDFPLGAIVGVVEIVDCVRTETRITLSRPDDDYWCGDWTPGRFAWRAESPVRLAEPIEFRGRQGLFDVTDPDVIRRVQEQL